MKCFKCNQDIEELYVVYGKQMNINMQVNLCKDCVLKYGKDIAADMYELLDSWRNMR